MGQATALTIQGRSVVSLRAKLPLLAEGAPESWVEMAYESAWKGHHAGEFAFTRAALESIVARFDADENPLPVTYGHPDHSAGKPTPAGGWIREMQVRDGSEGAELWGRVEWTETAAQHIRAGEYRYCSVVVDFAPIDRATGEPAGLAEMYELALTNSPFLPGMTPITLSRVGTPARPTQRTLAMATPMDPTKMVEGVAKSLGLKKDATLEEIKALLDAVFAFVGAMPGSAKGAPPDVAAAAAELSRIVKLDDFPAVNSEEAAAEAMESAGTMVMGKLTTATGLDEAAVLAGIEANLDAIAQIITGTAPAGMSSDAQAAQLSRTNTELTAVRIREKELARDLNAAKVELARFAKEAEAAAAEKKDADIKAAFDGLVSCGKAVERQRANFVTLARHSLADATAFFEDTDAVPQGSVVTRDKAAPGNGATSLAKGDPRAEKYLAIARSEGLRGKAAEDRAAVFLAKHDATHTDA